MRNAFVCLMMLFLFGGSVLVTAQRTKPGLPGPPADKAETVDESDPANQFPEKGLPEPAIIGSNPSESVAAELATDISRYEDDSLPLLMAALQKAGFYIIDQNQKILYRPTGGDEIGMAFYDFEVVGMLKASRAGAGTTIGKIAGSISQENQGEARQMIGEMILSDLKNARNSRNEQARFLAALIFEFGRNFPIPVDLAAVTSENAPVNFIQASIIERILIRDFINSYVQFEGASSFFLNDRPFPRAGNGLEFVNASWSVADDDPCAAITDLSALQKLEKTGKKTAETILIYKEMTKSIENTAKNVGKPKLPSILTKSQGFFKDYAKGISIVNAALSWAKLVMALSNVKAEITVQDPMPLIRTKSDRNTGEERVVTAKFKMDIANTELLNCAGKAFSFATGVSFSVPKGGPMTDKPVGWEVVMTGDRYGKYANTPVWVDAPNRSDASKQVTDSNGESKVTLTGKPQPRNLEQEPVVPLAKKVDLRISIALEKMKLTDDAPKIGKLGLGAEIDPVAIIEIIPDMLGKIKLSTFKARVPIRDWQPCSEDWGGTINYKREFSQTIVVKSNRTSNGNSTGDGVRTISQRDEAVITLNPRRQEDIPAKPPLPADIIVNGKHSDIFEGKREGDPCCGPVEGAYDTVFRTGKVDTYNDFVKRVVRVRYRGTERDYSLYFDFDIYSIKAKRNEFHEILSTSCPLEYAEAYSRDSEFETALAGALPSGRYPERYANSAGEILQGQKVQNSPDGAKITWSWALARCKK